MWSTSFLSYTRQNFLSSARFFFVSALLRDYSSIIFCLYLGARKYIRGQNMIPSQTIIHQAVEQIYTCKMTCPFTPTFRNIYPEDKIAHNFMELILTNCCYRMLEYFSSAGQTEPDGRVGRVNAKSSQSELIAP